MNVLRPPNQPSATQRINPFALNQVILVGLSTELSQLSKTIQRIKKALEEPTGIFQDFDIQVIDKLDLSGSRTTLVHQLNALAEGSRVQPFENLVILFVGHAETQSSYRLMLPERIMKSPLEPEARDWLRWDTFREWVSPIQTKNLLLMLDTPQAQGLRSKETLQWLRSLHQTEPGQKLLFFSNSHNQRGWRSKNSTYFAEALCTGLEQWEARDDRGVIDTDRLFQYLQKSIPERGLGNAEICQPPSRLQWPESSKHPMSLTYEKNRTELDGRLKNSLAIGKCLIWVGESLKHRCAPKAFPTRRQWKHHQQRAWIEYADSQRNPGLASVQLSAFGFPLLDSGVDSALERACVKQGYRIWYPNQPNPMQASSSQRKQALFRLSGAISTSNYVYEWEELEQQFKYFCEDFTQKPKWDSLLVIGIPFEEPTFRRWLKKLQQTIHNCWLVFPDEESYDRAQLLQKEGFRLIFGPENNILQQLQTIANLKTKGIKTEIIDVPLPEKNSPQISSIASAPNPYPGLLPFNQNQYDQFFGRSGCNGQKVN